LPLFCLAQPAICAVASLNTLVSYTQLRICTNMKIESDKMAAMPARSICMVRPLSPCQSSIGNGLG
jgi:hypothetical protein